MQKRPLPEDAKGRARQRLENLRLEDQGNFATDPQQELVEEGFAFLASSMLDPRARLPRPKDTPERFAQKRNAIINRTVPLGMVPLATSNGMLFLGAGRTTGGEGQDNECFDCYFPLPQASG